MATAFDRVGMSTATIGTGALTLGAALGNVVPNLASFMSFAAAGVANGQQVAYLILDTNNNWEVGVGVYTSSGTTLTRSPLWSSNSNNAISLSGSAQVYITEIAEDINQAGHGGFRNKFRNANFDVAQRGASGSVSAGATAYTLDGWQAAPTGAAVSWLQGYFNGIGNSHLKLSCASGITACTVQQRIESTVAEQLLLTPGGSAQPVTIQFTIHNNSGASFTPQLAVDDALAGQDNFSTVASDLAATNLQTIANGAIAAVAYTFVPNNALHNGMQVRLLLGGALNQASGDIKIAAADIRVTPGVATGLNNNPPPAELRPIGNELALCQRYLYVVNQSNAGANAVAFGQAFTASAAFFAFSLPQPQRAAPTITFSSPGHFSITNATAGLQTVTSFGYANVAAGETNVQINANVSGTPLVAGNGSGFFPNTAAARIYFSSEL
jgi:hypothetical protein